MKTLLAFARRDPGQVVWTLFAALLLCAFVFLQTGCNTPTTVGAHTDGSNIGASITNGNVGANATYNPVTDEWTGGIWISFPAAPKSETVAALARAGGKQITPRVWTLNYRARDLSGDAPALLAIQAALRERAILQPEPSGL